MTPAEQNIAIAKLCGWFTRPSVPPHEIHMVEGSLLNPSAVHPIPVWDHPNGPSDCAPYPPSYTTDLNAMHEAVQQFRFPGGGTLWSLNQHHLEEIVSRDRSHAKDGVSFQWEVQNASAAQRAEAFLKVHNIEP